MKSSVSLVTGPTVEPLTRDEAKEHLREDAADQNSYIDRLISAARRRVERDAWRVLITQTWDVFFDRFPASSVLPIVVPKPPLQSVTSVKYHDSDGTTTTALDSSTYIVDSASEPGRIALHDGEVWPSDLLRPANGVEIRIVAGYGDPTDVPEHLLQAMLLLIGHWYENREAAITGTIIQPVPRGYDDLVLSEKALRYA